MMKTPSNGWEDLKFGVNNVIILYTKGNKNLPHAKSGEDAYKR